MNLETGWLSFTADAAAIKEDHIDPTHCNLYCGCGGAITAQEIWNQHGKFFRFRHDEHEELMLSREYTRNEPWLFDIRNWLGTIHGEEVH